MTIDVKKLRPTELCQLLNSTPLGEVIKTRKLRLQRERAGLRFGGQQVDLYRYIAWLFQERHFPKQQPVKTEMAASPDFVDAALVAAEFVCNLQNLKGHGQKFTRKCAEAVAALLTESNHTKAAEKAGISKATLSRWFRLPEFQAALRRTRQAMLESSVGRMQAVSGLLVDTVINVALNGRRDSDRTRASLGLLDRACRGLPRLEALHVSDCDGSAAGSSASVKRLESALREVEQSDLSLADKARLIVTLTDSLQRTRNEEELAQRLEALEAVLQSRKEKAP